MNSTYKNLQQEFAAIQKKDQENAKKLLEFQQKEKNKRNIEGTISNYHIIILKIISVDNFLM